MKECQKLELEGSSIRVGRIARKSLHYKGCKTYRENGEKYRIKVDVILDDKCKNKMASFSVTGEIERQARNNRWVFVALGPLEEDIIRHFPELVKFIELHRVNHYGEGEVENFCFYAKEGNDCYAKKCLRVTDDEYEVLKPIALLDDKVYLLYKLEDMGVIARWKKEADEAITALEELCGYKWESPNKPEEERFKLEMPTESEILDLKKKIAEGYYTDEAIKARKEAKKKEDREIKRLNICQMYERKIREAERDMQVMLGIFDYGLSVDNVIYYSHRNTVVFNWLDRNRDKITREEFEDFVQNVDMGKFPEGIKFEIK